MQASRPARARAPRPFRPALRPVAIACLAWPGMAGLALAQLAPPALTAEETHQLERIVVTGNTSLKRTVRESSVAVTIQDREQLDRKAPRSTASALETVPGIIVEDSGGEASNNFSVRGLPGGGQQFIQLLEDGLPVFYTPALADTILKQELMIDRLEAVRGGTTSVLTVNGAGAMINFLTYRNPSSPPEGAVRVTVSDHNTRRVDLRYGGTLGGGWYGGFGGFFRSADSVRNTGFTADKGGVLRAHVGRKTVDTDWSVNLKLVNDHNTFLLPIPLQNLGSPEGIPSLSATHGTLLGRDNGIMTVKTSAATGATSQLNDAINDGIFTRSTSLGYAFERKLSPAWTVRSKGRYTDFKNDFNSVFSFSNDGLVKATERLDATKKSDVAAMLARFAAACAGACTPALQRVNDGQLFVTSAQLNAMNGNGLVAENVTANNKRYVKETVNDLSASWTTVNNSLTVGWLAFDTDLNKDQNVGATSFLSDVRNNANRMDIVALDPNGRIAGYLTDKSVLQYGAWGEGVNNAKATSHSIYVNDEWKVTDALRLDAGVRWEKYKITARHGIGATDTRIAGAFNAQGQDVDNIMANNNFGGAFSGQFNTVKSSFDKTSRTVGGNYLLNDNIALYGRYSAGYQANGENPVTRIAFTEAGLRYKARGISGTLTAFQTDYKNFQGFSAQVGNDTQATVANSDMQVRGLEFEGEWRPVRQFSLLLAGVVQKHDIKIKDVTGPSAGKYADELRAYSGNLPPRTPRVNLTLAPTYYLPDGRGEVSLSLRQVGKRYADLANTVALPAYRTLDLSGRYDLTDKWTINASVANLTNTVGLTEGNPRGGGSAFQEKSSSNYFFARPILGRNVQLSLTYAL